MGLIKMPRCARNEDGSPSEDWCTGCVKDGEFAEGVTLDEMIENCAPRMAEMDTMTADEAVSLLSAVLPQFKRWKK